MTDGAVLDQVENKEPLQDRAYRLLRKAICRGQFAPGTILSENHAAQTFELTKAPVRSALRRLEHEGWLTVSARRGYEVRPITLRDTQDIFGLRKIVEPQAAFMATGRMTPERLAELEGFSGVSYLADVSAEDNNELFFAANRAFHVGIAQATDNLRLVQIIENLHDECDRILRFGMQHLNWSIDWQHGHEAIIDAIRAGDATGAQDIAHQQLATSERIVTEALMQGVADLPIGSSRD